jgi:hypothetical protein
MARVYVLLLALTPFLLHGQTKVSFLQISARDTFQVDNSGSLVADTLIMNDSSFLLLNPKKTTNYIHVKTLIIGRQCVIDGRGQNGAAGPDGINGSGSFGPCRNGGNGRAGSKGSDGKPGLNLFLYLEKIIVNGNLIIDLAGGSGGDGGDGGEGGGGSPGTVHCKGGNGGIGGEAGSGGNGGPGGTLTFSGGDQETIRLMLGSQIVVNTLGGNFGYGGIPGGGGSAGLGPRKSGEDGKNGKNGLRGRPGSDGVIQFEQQ